jgi:hypothetical protein
VHVSCGAEIFVISDNSRAYPAYLVSYQSLGPGRARQVQAVRVSMSSHLQQPSQLRQGLWNPPRPNLIQTIANALSNAGRLGQDAKSRGEAEKKRARDPEALPAANSNPKRARRRSDSGEGLGGSAEGTSPHSLGGSAGSRGGSAEQTDGTGAIVID